MAIQSSASTHGYERLTFPGANERLTFPTDQYDDRTGDSQNLKTFLNPTKQSNVASRYGPNPYAADPSWTRLGQSGSRAFQPSLNYNPISGERDSCPPDCPQCLIDSEAESRMRENPLVVGTDATNVSYDTAQRRDPVFGDSADSAGAATRVATQLKIRIEELAALIADAYSQELLAGQLSQSLARHDLILTGKSDFEEEKSVYRKRISGHRDRKSELDRQNLSLRSALGEMLTKYVGAATQVTKLQARLDASESVPKQLSKDLTHFFKYTEISGLNKKYNLDLSNERPSTLNSSLVGVAA